MHKIKGGVMELVKKEWNGKRERSVLEADIYIATVHGGSVVSSDGASYPFTMRKVLVSGFTEQEARENVLKGWGTFKEHII